jgi:hypothetical protein
LSLDAAERGVFGGSLDMTTSGDSLRLGRLKIRVSAGPLQPSGRGIGPSLRRERRGNFPKIFDRFALRALREFLHFVATLHIRFNRRSKASERKPENIPSLYYWLSFPWPMPRKPLQIPTATKPNR